MTDEIICHECGINILGTEHDIKLMVYKKDIVKFCGDACKDIWKMKNKDEEYHDTDDDAPIENAETLTDEEKDEFLKMRDKFKLEITQNISEIMYKAMDDEIVPYLEWIDYPDMVDIACGIFQALCHNQLDQIAQMKQEGAFMAIKQRWILVTLEMMKSMHKIRYEPVKQEATENNG